jgi:hypothetical protein
MNSFSEKYNGPVQYRRSNRIATRRFALSLSSNAFDLASEKRSCRKNYEVDIRVWPWQRCSNKKKVCPRVCHWPFTRQHWIRCWPMRVWATCICRSFQLTVEHGMALAYSLGYQIFPWWAPSIGPRQSITLYMSCNIPSLTCLAPLLCASWVRSSASDPASIQNEAGNNRINWWSYT